MSKRAKAIKDNGILVAADDLQIQRLLKSIFEANGYQVILAVDVATAIQMHAHHPQLVVLDLDVSSGGDAIPEIRRFSDIPVVALSSRHAEADLVAALDLGADDYIEKPFRTGELLARVRSVLRRGFRGRGEEAVYRFGPLEVNILDHVVRRYGEPIRLAPTTFEILSLLVVINQAGVESGWHARRRILFAPLRKRPHTPLRPQPTRRYARPAKMGGCERLLLVRNMGRLVPYQQFIDPPNGKYCCANKRALHSAMRVLREKIEDDPGNPRMIINEEGFGYRLAKPPPV